MCEGERLNFYRLSLMIMDGGTPTLKWLFEKQYAASGDLEIFLKSRTTVLDSLHKRKIITLRQMDLLRPSTGIKPSVEKFDTSLLITLLTNICQIQQPHGGWRVSPAASDLCTGADILRVRDARNNLFHHAKCGISDAEFQLKSSIVYAAISRLSNKLDQQQQVKIQKIINDARHAAGDFGREKEICNLIFLDKIDEIHRLVQGIYDRGNHGAIAGLAGPKARRSLLKDDQHDGIKDQPNIDMGSILGKNSRIIVVKLYADLKKELTRKMVMSIAKVLLKEENSTAVLEEIERASSRGLCIDSLFKRVIHREAATVQSFLIEIKSKCPVMANLLAKTIITEEDRKNFNLIDDRGQTRGRICSRVHIRWRINEADVKFFQHRLYYLPENVDKIADVLLSKFCMSFYDRSEVTLQSNVFDRIRVLFETIHLCHLDSVSELESVLGSKLYKEWMEFKNETSGPNGDITRIWQSIIQRISSAAASLMESFCQTFHIDFIRSERASLVLIFKAGDNFSIELLKPESVKKEVRELLEKTCPEHHPLFKDPIHVTIFIKSAKYGDKEEIHFFLETNKDRKEIEDVHSHFGRHERAYMIEEMDPTPLKQWMFERLKIDECTKIHLEDIISWNDIGRGEKMKILIDTLERFEDGYELLQRYCEENDKFVYDRVFQKARPQSRTDHKTELGYNRRKGMQKLFSTWIDFNEDPTESHRASEVLVIDKRKLPGIKESAIHISQGNVGKGQSNVKTAVPTSGQRPMDPDNGKQEGVRDQNSRLLDEIKRNFASGKKVKNILLVGLPSAGKSSLINSLACLILGKYVPVASVGQGAAQLTHTYAAHRYNHFGICEEHLRGSPNEDKARIMHPHLPNLYDFIGLADANTEELKEILSLQIFGHLEPGLQITSLFKSQRRHGVGSLRSWYTKSEEAWKIDVVFFVHSVTTSEVPKELIQCILDVIKPKDTLRPVDVEFYIVLTKMDKVKTGMVTEENVNAIENAVADSFGIHGFKEYKLVKIANWCDDVGFPNSPADYLDGLDEQSVILNNQMLKLLRNMSIPKAESKITHDITVIQKMWFCLYGYFTTIIRMFYFEPFGPRDILYAALFGLLVIIVVFILILR